MRKIDKVCWILGILFVLGITAQQAWATCTYSAGVDSNTTIASCNTTTEAAPTLATEGKSLSKTTGFSVMATASANMTAGGQLQAYLYNSDAAQWVRSPDLDVTIASAATNQAWSGFVVTVPKGRVDYRPSGIGAVNSSIYIVGQPQ